MLSNLTWARWDVSDFRSRSLNAGRSLNAAAEPTAAAPTAGAERRHRAFATTAQRRGLGPLHACASDGHLA